MIGTVLSHYKILEKLGEGGMGVVYKAEDTKLDRIVALKFLPPHLAASEQDKARFIQEAKAASALNHPNVCTIYAIEDHEGQMFIAMEFVDGQTLREKKGSVSFKQAIDIGIMIADGLAAAHEKGIVHRDIKPENIMLRKDGIAQIMDFGLAKLRASGSKITRLTKEGSTVGTAGYMSPEQVQGQDSDHRSDIFSYGVVLYELLAGQMPFKGVHETALAYEIVNVDPPPMSAVKPDLDPNLDAIVLECLEKDPRERNQSIAQVSLDLKRYRRESSKQKMSRITAARPILQTSGIQQPSDYAQNAPAAPSAPRAKGLSWLPWAVAMLFALGFAALGVVHFRETPPVMPSINAVLPPPAGYAYDASIGGHMALSPNGTMLAFVAVDSAGKGSLWVRPLGSSTARQLPETFGASFPFWAPDNMTIGYFVPGKMKKISISGTPAVVICDAQSGRGGTWNMDGVILFAPSFDLVGISRVSAGGGIPAAVTHVDSSRNESNHRWPHFLPDGKHFIYTTQAKIRTVDYVGGIYVAALDSSVNKLLIKVSSNMDFADGRLIYVRQNSVVAQPFDLSTLELSGDASPVVEHVEYSNDKSRGSFSIAQNGFFAYQPAGNNPRRLWMTNRAGEKIRDVGDRTLYTSTRLSSDGTKVAFDSQDSDQGLADIWLYDLVRGLSTRFTFDPSSEWQPVWSSDGARIVYATDKTGSGDLFIKNTNGTDASEVFLKDVPPKSAMDCSPDGKYLLYYLFSPTSKEDIWVLPMNGTKTPAVFLQTEFSETNGRFSPDGRWVVYQSDESGSNEIYVRPFPTGNGKWQISTSGGEFPVWSRDGKEIFYHQSGGITMTVSVDGSGAAFSVGAAKKLFDIPRSIVFDATADGQQFLTAILLGAQTAAPVTLITQWDRDLKSK